MNDKGKPDYDYENNRADAEPSVLPRIMKDNVMLPGSIGEIGNIQVTGSPNAHVMSDNQFGDGSVIRIGGIKVSDVSVSGTLE